MIDLCNLIIDEENLGIDENPDILFVGFSAMDYIIHNYGPFSQEAWIIYTFRYAIGSFFKSY